MVERDDGTELIGRLPFTVDHLVHVVSSGHPAASPSSACRVPALICSSSSREVAEVLEHRTWRVGHERIVGADHDPIRAEHLQDESQGPGRGHEQVDEQLPGDVARARREPFPEAGVEVPHAVHSRRRQSERPGAVARAHPQVGMTVQDALGDEARSGEPDLVRERTPLAAGPPVIVSNPYGWNACTKTARPSRSASAKNGA